MEKEENFDVHCPLKECSGILKPTSKTMEEYRCSECDLTANRMEFLDLEKDEYEEENAKYSQSLTKQQERERARKRAGLETEE